MRALLSLSLLSACAGEKEPRPDAEEPDSACAGCGEDTAPPDTAPPEETGETAPPDTADTAPPPDTGDTGEPPEPPCTAATFTDKFGVATDMTEVFTTGDYVTLSDPGTLTFCPGEWYVRVTLEADIDVLGLGEAAADTVLSGGEQATVVTILGPALVSIENVAISRGRALGVGNGATGGGISCEQNGFLTLTNALIVDNASYDGGGLYAYQCDLDISSVDFVSNHAKDDGAGMSLWFVDAVLDDVLFEGGTANDGGGAAVYNSTLDVRNSHFEANDAAYYGGALWTYDATLEVTDSVFLNNTNTMYGGALWLFGTSVLSGLTLQGNTAAEGGAVYHYRYSGSWIEGADCDFADNSPDDVRATQQPGLSSLGKGASFTCDMVGCEEN